MNARQIQHLLMDLEDIEDKLCCDYEERNGFVHEITRARHLIVQLVRERDYEEAAAWLQLNNLMADQMLRVVR